LKFITIVKAIKDYLFKSNWITIFEMNLINSTLNFNYTIEILKVMAKLISYFIKIIIINLTIDLEEVS
jgi:hypothetical protein